MQSVDRKFLMYGIAVEIELFTFRKMISASVFDGAITKRLRDKHTFPLICVWILYNRLYNSSSIIYMCT